MSYKKSQTAIPPFMLPTHAYSESQFDSLLRLMLGRPVLGRDRLGAGVALQHKDGPWGGGGFGTLTVRDSWRMGNKPNWHLTNRTVIAPRVHFYVQQPLFFLLLLSFSTAAIPAAFISASKATRAAAMYSRCLCTNSMSSTGSLISRPGWKK